MISSLKTPIAASYCLRFVDIVSSYINHLLWFYWPSGRASDQWE